MSRFIESLWYRFSPWHILLWPLSWLYAGLSTFRRTLYRAGVCKTGKLPVPVIVVGNITAGGSGKTPLVIWLVDFLRSKGYAPGVVSRGYGRDGNALCEVSAQSDAASVGDEPLLIFRRAACPVVVGADRVAAARMLLRNHPHLNVIISDDGLQHYRLARDVEICVVDGERGFGNGMRIPAGPLREKLTRLDAVDAIVVNGEKINFSIKTNIYKTTMQLVGDRFFNLKQPQQQVPAADFKQKKIHAIAGIGNPGRFFAHLHQLGLEFSAHAFPDHFRFRAADLAFNGADAVLMTEKDAVKCRTFATDRHWALAVSAQLDESFGAHMLKQLTQPKDPKK
ncbi:MAG: tetraacyldisaccharide 4'-kinase [Burkholderiales bacterium]